MQRFCYGLLSLVRLLHLCSHHSGHAGEHLQLPWKVDVCPPAPGDNQFLISITVRFARPRAGWIYTVHALLCLAPLRWMI